MMEGNKSEINYLNTNHKVDTDFIMYMDRMCEKKK